MARLRKSSSRASISELKELLTELRYTLQRIKGEPRMAVMSDERNSKVLRHQINQLTEIIYDTTDDVYLKAVVNSVFDSISANCFLS